MENDTFVVVLVAHFGGHGQSGRLAEGCSASMHRSFTQLLRRSCEPTRDEKLDKRLGNNIATAMVSLGSIQTLESSLKHAIEHGGSLNSLMSLFRIAVETDDPTTTHKSVWAQYRLFYQLFSEDYGYLEKEATSPSGAVRSWIRERTNDYTLLLCSLLKDEEGQLRVRRAFC